MCGTSQLPPASRSAPLTPVMQASSYNHMLFSLFRMRVNHDGVQQHVSAVTQTSLLHIHMNEPVTL